MASESKHLVRVTVYNCSADKLTTGKRSPEYKGWGTKKTRIYTRGINCVKSVGNLKRSSREPPEPKETNIVETERESGGARWGVGTQTTETQIYERYAMCIEEEASKDVRSEISMRL